MIKAKISLGQNFLIDKNIINKIVNLVDIKDKNILEIGPGTGNLSEQILKKKPNNFIVISRLPLYFPRYTRLVIVFTFVLFSF